MLIPVYFGSAIEANPVQFLVYEDVAIDICFILNKSRGAGGDQLLFTEKKIRTTSDSQMICDHKLVLANSVSLGGRVMVP